MNDTIITVDGTNTNWAAMDSNIFAQLPLVMKKILRAPFEDPELAENIRLNNLVADKLFGEFQSTKDLTKISAETLKSAEFVVKSPAPKL